MMSKSPPPGSEKVSRSAHSGDARQRGTGGLGLVRWQGLTLVGSLSIVDRLVSVSGLVEVEGGVYRPINSLMLVGRIS